MNRNNIINCVKRLLRCYFPHPFPNTCVLCQAFTDLPYAVCPACEAELPRLDKACQWCALPLLEKWGIEQQCFSCAQKAMRPNYRIFSPFSYQFPISELIIELKFKKRLMLAQVLAELMVKKMKTVYQKRRLPDVIIPVPLHARRLRHRGFNQALELAKPLSQAMRIPLNYRACSRTQLTRPQAKLSAEDRASNVQNAFAVAPYFHANHICLVDDVLTTGNTAIALSEALFKAGAHSIDVWCCARANLSPLVS